MNEERRREVREQLSSAAKIAGCDALTRGADYLLLRNQFESLAREVGVYDEPEPSKAPVPGSVRAFVKEAGSDGTDLKDAPPSLALPPCVNCTSLKVEAADPASGHDWRCILCNLYFTPKLEPQAPPCPHCKSDDVVMQTGSDLETDGDYWECRDCGEPNRVPYSAPPAPSESEEEPKAGPTDEWRNYVRKHLAGLEFKRISIEARLDAIESKLVVPYGTDLKDVPPPPSMDSAPPAVRPTGAL